MIYTRMFHLIVTSKLIDKQMKNKQKEKKVRECVGIIYWEGGAQQKGSFPLFSLRQDVEMKHSSLLASWQSSHLVSRARRCMNGEQSCLPHKGLFVFQFEIPVSACVWLA